MFSSRRERVQREFTLYKHNKRKDGEKSIDADSDDEDEKHYRDKKKKRISATFSERTFLKWKIESKEIGEENHKRIRGGKERIQ